jgi:hypothetical protein
MTARFNAWQWELQSSRDYFAPKIGFKQHRFSAKLKLQSIYLAEIAAGRWQSRFCCRNHPLPIGVMRARL